MLNSDIITCSKLNPWWAYVMTSQVKLAIDGQGQYEVEEGKHFFYSVAEQLRAK